MSGIIYCSKLDGPPLGAKRATVEPLAGYAWDDFLFQVRCGTSERGGGCKPVEPRASYVWYDVMLQVMWGTSEGAKISLHDSFKNMSTSSILIIDE
jgi:hypothetical protein